MLYTVVRYSEMQYRGLFKVDDGAPISAGQHCIVKTPRGVELGKVLCDPIEHAGEVEWARTSRVPETREAAARPPEDLAAPEAPGRILLSGEVLRPAAPEDVERVLLQRAAGTAEEEAFCNERIKAHNLQMKLAGVEYLFEGEKIIFYFLAEGRVDFRALVRDLAKKYRTRIEMKQIGVRDEARLLAEYEHCGRRLCCKDFLSHLEPVTMRMAKSQKTTLDPSKISGRCGRLMCCLRYEDHVYQELKNQLPRKGHLVILESGKFRVVSQDVLLQKLLVESQAGERQVVHLSEVKGVEGPAPQRPSSRPPDGPRRARPDKRSPDRTN